jgi:hypothetical protein
MRPILVAVGAPLYWLAKYLTDSLTPLIGQIEHLKNLTESMPKLQQGEVLVSFDVSLFINSNQFIHSTLSRVTLDMTNSVYSSYLD